MNKFFKRIIPATILATCCTVSVFSMTACNEGKDYSDDFAKLQQQIDDQKNQINDLQNENNSLKDQISNITPGGTDYTEEIEKLQQQIEALKVQNANYLQESEKLKQQIETLKTQNGSNLAEIAKLEQQLETLKTNNESNIAEIDRLKAQIEELKQNSGNVELKTYKIGDTFTYSYQGVDYFSLTLKDRSTLIIKNLNMINFIPDQIIAFKFYITVWNDGIMPSSKIQIGKEFTIQNIALADEALKYTFGYPIGADGILPYAIFDLTSST